MSGLGSLRTFTLFRSWWDDTTPAAAPPGAPDGAPSSSPALPPRTSPAAPSPSVPQNVLTSPSNISPRALASLEQVVKLFKAGKVTRASLELLRAERLLPAAEHWRVAPYHAYSAFLRGDDSAAFRSIQTLLAHRPDDAAGLALHGLLLSRQGRRNESSQSLRRAAEHAPNGLWFRTAAAWVAHGLHNNVEARAQFTRALELEPDNVLTRAGLILCNEDPATRHAEMETLFATVASEPLAYVFRALAAPQNSKSEADAAIALLATALRLNPDEPAALLHRANLLMRWSRLDEASVDVARLTQLRPADPRTWVQQSYLTGLRGDYPKALQHLHTAKQRGLPLDAAYYRLRARWLIASGDTQAGAQCVEAARQLDAQNGVLIKLIAEIDGPAPNGPIRT